MQTMTVNYKNISNDNSVIEIEFDDKTITWVATAKFVDNYEQPNTKGPEIDGKQTEVKWDKKLRTVQFEPLIDLFISTYTEGTASQQGFDLLKEKYPAEMFLIMQVIKNSNDILQQMEAESLKD
ncbi:hypothetical protein FOD75_11065 (plasmid) [Limosilactobacillus reuteri]|uniref:Phage protein n=1 Tax=Limosilactobacillus reuteri TaxID=1598 RepID=A0A517D8F7_LIMRT|nr:hypothetical protein [Limosilactobacillus reuteri]QDR73629.1 hypothetical protein FOD75_11065 [Limosilactobacillus reuteri]